MFSFQHEKHFPVNAQAVLCLAGHSKSADPADLIWRDIHETAVKVASAEPFLMDRLRRLVLIRSSLQDIVAATLAYRLSCADMRERELYALCRCVFEEDECLLAQLVADFDAVKTRDPSCLNHLHVLLNMKGIHALETYRVAHWLWRRNRKELAFSLANMAASTFCVDIHPAARIGGGVMIDHGTGVVIGETAVIDDNVSILQEVTLGGTGKERGDRHPKIRTGVMIGAGAKVLGNIEIGAMSKVAAGSVVLENVPPHCTVAGVPARIVRLHDSETPPAFEMDQSVGQTSSE